jgi:hypothetical protein
LIANTPGHVDVSQGNTTLFSQPVNLAAFVPRTAITYHVPWVGKPVQGTYRVTGELFPAGAVPIMFDQTVTFGGAAIRQFRQQTGRSAQAVGTPVALIVGLVGALAAALAFAAAYARLRARVAGQS